MPVGKIIHMHTWDPLKTDKAGKVVGRDVTKTVTVVSVKLDDGTVANVNNRLGDLIWVAPPHINDDCLDKMLEELDCFAEDLCGGQNET